jgi:hypothetical protein
MKTPRLLPETDLARAALLPDDQKWIILRGVKSFKPPYSLAPLRKVVAAAYNARASLLELPRCTWPDIEAAIHSYCRTSPHWVEPNLAVARALFDFNQKRKVSAVEWEFRDVSVGYGAKMKFWHNFYSIQDGVPVLSFVDPRLQDGLGILGRTFIFSAMHHLVAVGDFEGARLEILRFPKNPFKPGERRVELFKFDESDVVEEVVLNQAIDRTFKIWREVLAERTEESRRNPPTGTDGELGF